MILEILHARGLKGGEAPAVLFVQQTSSMWQRCPTKIGMFDVVRETCRCLGGGGVAGGGGATLDQQNSMTF